MVTGRSAGDTSLALHTTRAHALTRGAPPQIVTPDGLRLQQPTVAGGLMRIACAMILGFLMIIPSMPVARGSAPAGGADRLDVATESGVVRGIATAHGREWRGIPYVAAPVGPRRWKPPHRAPSWDGVRAADRLRPRCIQLISETETKGREDCLYLNVFAPVGARRGDSTEASTGCAKVRIRMVPPGV